MNSFYDDFDEPEKLNTRLLKKVPQFNYQKALQDGYSIGEINEFLEDYAPEDSLVQQGARIGGQYLLGAAENALLPYELGVAPLASKESQQVPYRENLGADVEDLLMQKEYGQWNEDDEKFLQNLMGQMEDPRKSEKFIKTADLSIRNIAEKVTGLDLEPEGVAEKAAHWAGFIKNPSSLKDLAKSGLSKKDIIKAIAPSGEEAMRGLGAGIALQMAEDGEYGPIGTMAAAIVGDVIGGSIKMPKINKENFSSPKRKLAETLASFGNKEKKELQKEIIQDFRKAGLQADLGTITDNDLIRWTQSRLAQSGLTGKKLSEFKDELTNQIKNEYKAIAETLGEAKFSTLHEAGEVVKEGIRKIRDADLEAVRSIYNTANQSLSNNAKGQTNRVANALQNLERDLKPGSLKSGEQTAVLNATEKLKKDIFDADGKRKLANIKDLINDKIALGNIIDYEVQGGTKQLLKPLLGELDRAILSIAPENPIFARNYINAQKRFSEHAKTFRNKEINSLLRSLDPSQVMNKMNTVHGIKSLEKALTKTPEGREIFNNLKRLKLDKVIGDNLVDSTTQQAKLGTFSKLLDKGKNREIIKEILGPEAFKRLERLQKNAGRLANSADKFYNASKSGAVAVDAAVIAKGLSALANLLSGNPWPLLKTGLGIGGGKQLSNLIADPQFLKLVEDAILAAEKESSRSMNVSVHNLLPYFQRALGPALINDFESRDGRSSYQYTEQ